MKIWNFAFGSHLDLGRYAEIIEGKPAQRMKAILRDHRLTASALTRFPKEHEDLAGTGGGPRFIPQQESQVYGVLYEIDSKQWALLDQYERAWAYESLPVEAQTENGRIVKALAHNLVEFGRFSPPSDQFLKYMAHGLRDLGYSEKIIEEVRNSVLLPI
ncbi:gamma-glutamylcyclotransferase [Candidatus Acetothermia bacterium]|nr:gamma-glutamylcyclotransferase [Candidatus Acetothermia bacterium]MBI3643286.1 gamma-glutamylcyclotransferase [Candidatus Acetothermia bacterium]